MCSFQTASKFSSMLKQPTRNLVLDSEKANYLEYYIYHCFAVDIMNIISVKAQLSKAFSIIPSEVDSMAYWEFEFWLKELEKLVKEEKDEHEKEMGSYDMGKMMKTNNSNMQSMMKHQSSSFKMPSMPSIK